MKNLDKDLCRPWLEQRKQLVSLPIQLRTSIKKFIGDNESLDTKYDNNNNCDDGERLLCFLCPIRKNRKTKIRCKTCSNPICGEHTIRICTNCGTNQSSTDDDV